MRETIDFGIDLGTTNSSIALFKGMEHEVFKSNENWEYTPSAVWMDKHGALIVGQRAYERLVDDEENAFAEFKLRMGTGEEKVFARNGRRMKPEELSAEVLKSLKADVRRRTGEEIQSAVITVPAAFELPQCDATKKAAELAGLTFSPLLQEPVAAALAYGFQSDSDRVFWLVYDLGGGTFDAAVMQVRDGVIQVVNHGGDNHLGGKLVDWEIVEQLLVPAVTKEYRLTDFNRGNEKWKAAFAKLKMHAEKAKIRVSRDESAEIIEDFLCHDDRGDPVEFEYELNRKELEQIMEPFFLRSINISKKVLAEKRLGPDDIEKILLVGGPTWTPYLRERLADRKEGLGIPLEFREDPLTVVSRGAAIFAATQRVVGVLRAPVALKQYVLELEYKPIGADAEPLVGGKVVAHAGEDLSGFTIEFINAEGRPQWRSGKLGLAPNGVFMTNLWAEKGRQNTFLIELCDPMGVKQETVPDRLTYTIGLSITDPPLTHHLGVGLATGEMDWFFKKGTPLPDRQRHCLHTALEFRRGQTEPLCIPVMEGQKPRADRNTPIGHLEIESSQVKRDVPAGSEVEVTIDIDQSRIMRLKAYFPILDEEFEKVIYNYEDYGKKDRDELKKEIEQEKKRLEEARRKSQQTGDPVAQQALHGIDAERMVHDVDSSFDASLHDTEAALDCQNRLRDLKAAIDEVEDALEWPTLVAQAEKEIEIERNIINNPDFGVTADEKIAFAALEPEIRSAVGTKDADLLRRKVQEMDRIGLFIMFRQPVWWVGQLENMEKKKHVMSDQALADIYIEQGRRAVANSDLEALGAAVRQLASLLPAIDEDRRKFDSGVIR